MILRAVAEARAAGAATVFLPASEDDRPQTLYRRLGFDAVARYYKGPGKQGLSY